MKPYKYNKLQLAWIEALMSGAYRKCSNGLGQKVDKTHTTYCCLGVACVVSNKNHKTLGSPLVPKSVDGWGGVAFDAEETRLPNTVADALKLRSHFGSFKKMVDSSSIKGIRETDAPTQHFADLVDMNDGGVSHRKIAEYIVANPHNVFKR